MEEKLKKLEKRIQTLTKALNDLHNNYEEKVLELSIIRKTADLFTYEFDLKEACKKTLNLLSEELHPENSSILILEPETGIYEPYAFKGRKLRSRKNSGISDQMIGKNFRSGEGAAGWAAQNKKIIQIPDITVDNRFSSDINTRVPISSIICVPLLNQNTVEGILNLSHSKTNAFPKRSVNFLNILMKSIGTGIGNIRLFREYTEANSSLLKSNRELQDTLKDLHDTRSIILNSQKLSGIRVLAAGIAHEFNNILAGIYGYSELSLLTKNPTEISSNIRNILKLSNKGTHIVNNLLTFAGKSKISRKTININTLFNRLDKIIGPEIKNLGIVLEKNLGKIPSIKCDASQVSQVFLQLISNARDSMLNSGGVLKITTSKTAKYVKAVIEDTGKGIEPEILENIFDPFVTTKGAFGGGIPERHGLGLSVAYGIVKEHKGEIKIESQLKKGCKVTVLLPFDPAGK
ncbi:ATP-binding protein [candidate division KSB1 bacterium]